MKQKDILRHNELIAIFMGYKKKEDFGGELSYWTHNDKYMQPKSIIRLDKGEELLYHNSWEWLIPAYKKVSEWLDQEDASLFDLYHTLVYGTFEELYKEIVSCIEYFNGAEERERLRDKYPYPGAYKKLHFSPFKSFEV